jgi:serine/threonine protein kinase
MPERRVAEFIERLAQSQLLSTAQLEIARGLAAEDAKSLARQLVSRGWLTHWQAATLLEGQLQYHLGKYRLVDLLGTGGMGAVFKAVQTGIGRTVAIKVLSRKVLKKPTAVPRFLREIRSAAALDHPNIVTAYDADKMGETYYFVMEFVDGQDLRAWLKQWTRLPIDWACECIRQAALGLQCAHERGMVHRDIKPSNLLITQAEPGGPPLLKILDFGLARFASETEEAEALTRAGQVLGTPDYIAPEQVEDTRAADIRADIFSLGCTLFELLTGALPFGGVSVVEKLLARTQQDAQRAAALRPEIPEALDAIVARMLARDPAVRYQTPSQVAEALSPFALTTSRLEFPAESRQPGEPAIVAGDPDSTLNEFLANLARAPAGQPRGERAARRRGSRHRGRRARRRLAAVITILAIALAGGLALAVWVLPSWIGTAPSNGKGNTEAANPDAGKKAAEPPPAPSLAGATERDHAVALLRLGAALGVARQSSSGVAPPGPGNRLSVKMEQELPAWEFRVVEADLSGNPKVTGLTLERVGILTALESLKLRDNRINDAGLEALSGLVELTSLELANTQVADKGLAHLARLSNLKRLLLSRTEINGEGLVHLLRLRKLTELHLDGTRVNRANLRVLGEFQQLKVLSLARTSLNDQVLADVSRAPRLESMDLSVTSITDQGLAELARCKHLQSLRLLNLKIGDAALVHLAKIPSLQHVWLDRTQVTAEGLKHLKPLAHLSTLSLVAAPVADSGMSAIEALGGLTVLDLSQTRVSDDSVDHLAKLWQLRSLNVTGARLTSAGIARLRGALPLCRIAP